MSDSISRDEATRRTDNDATQAESRQQQVPDFSVQDYLRQFVSLLASQVWLRLGLVVNPATNKQETDLPQARLGITVLEYMIDQLEPFLEPAEKKEYETLEANLKLNYVQREAELQHEASQSESSEAPDSDTEAPDSDTQATPGDDS